MYNTQQVKIHLPIIDSVSKCTYYRYYSNERGSKFPDMWATEILIKSPPPQKKVSSAVVQTVITKKLSQFQPVKL